MKFTFIIPAYNRAHILGNALNSIMAQEGEHDFEILVCDDGSTDNTRDFVKNLQNPHIRYFYQENQGPSSARNLGLKNACGEWIVYLDDDNTLKPEYLNTIEKYLKENPKALYIIPRQERIIKIYDGEKLLEVKDNTYLEQAPKLVQDYFHKKNYPDTNGFAHHRSFIDTGVKWDTNNINFEDLDFFMQIAEKKPDNFLYIDEVVVSYVRKIGRGQNGRISSQTYEKWKNSFDYIYNKHKDSPLMQGQTWYPVKPEDYKKD